MSKHNSCCCHPALKSFPIKHQLPVELENGQRGYIMVSEAEYERIQKKIQEKREIREIFE